PPTVPAASSGTEYRGVAPRRGPHRDGPRRADVDGAAHLERAQDLHLSGMRATDPAGRAARGGLDVGAYLRSRGRVGRAPALAHRVLAGTPRLGQPRGTGGSGQVPGVHRLT